MRRHTALVVLGVLAIGVALFPERAVARCGVVRGGHHVRCWRPSGHPRFHVSHYRPARYTGHCVPHWRPRPPVYRYRPVVWCAPRPTYYHPAGALGRVVQRFAAAFTPTYVPPSPVVTYATSTWPAARPRYAGAVTTPSRQPSAWTTSAPSPGQAVPTPTPDYATCPSCRGTGRIPCSRCAGTGRVTIVGDWGPIARACPTCGGTGRSAHVCPRCSGSGRVLSQ